MTAIVRSESLSAPTITLDNPSTDASVFPGGPKVIDPMSKVWTMIGKLTTRLALADGGTTMKLKAHRFFEDLHGKV